MSKYSLMKNGNIKITLKVKLTRQSGRTRIFDAQEKKIDIRTVGRIQQGSAVATMDR